MNFKSLYSYSANLGCFCPCCEVKEHTSSNYAEACWSYSSGGKDLCTDSHFGGGDKCYYQC